MSTFLQKAKVDSKGTLRFLVTKLNNNQFDTVRQLFERSNKKIPLSRFRPLQGLPMDTVDQLLQSLQGSKLKKEDWDKLQETSEAIKDKQKVHYL